MTDVIRIICYMSTFGQQECVGRTKMKNGTGTQKTKDKKRRIANFSFQSRVQS